MDRPLTSFELFLQEYNRVPEPNAETQIERDAYESMCFMREAFMEDFMKALQDVATHIWAQMEAEVELVTEPVEQKGRLLN